MLTTWQLIQIQIKKCCVRALLEACTQNLLNTENLTARLEGSILRNGVLTKLVQRYLDWVRDHPLKTSAPFPDCLTAPSPISAFFTSIHRQISRNFAPFPLPNCQMSFTCPLTGLFWLLSHVIYLKLTRVL